MAQSLDCTLCLTRQALEAARFATDDPGKHETVLKQAFQTILDRGFTTISPLVAQEIQRIVKKETGDNDPYAKVKKEFNELMLSVRDSLRKRIQDSGNPLKTAIQLAIAGNTIDYAVRADWTKDLVFDAIEDAMRQSINGDLDGFLDRIAKAKNILYLLDNCGEIICDQLLIEQLKEFRPDLEITAVVRGAPVLNDATMLEARQIGLDQTVRVIDNGNDVIGTLLEQCGDEFFEAFDKADLILAKGLANFETLTEYDEKQLPKTVCFLFKAKCPFISGFAGAKLGDLVIRIRDEMEKQ